MAGMWITVRHISDYFKTKLHFVGEIVLEFVFEAFIQCGDYIFTILKTNLINKNNSRNVVPSFKQYFELA